MQEAPVGRLVSLRVHLTPPLGRGTIQVNRCSDIGVDLIPFMEPPNDDIRQKADALEQSANKIGLYMQGFAMGAIPKDGHPFDQDDEAEAQLLLLATFAVGEEAFSDRVMNPEKYDEDGKFRELAIEADPTDIILSELAKEYEQYSDEEDEK